MQKLISERLTELVASIKYEDLPPEIIERVKGAVLDQLGCQLIASTLEWNKIPYRFIRDLEGKPECTIVNYGTKAPLHDAAYVNGVFGQGAELDDVFQKGGAHPGSFCVPAAMALAEKGHNDGKQFIDAVLAGYELAFRLVHLMVPGVYDRGFHPHSVIGVFAVAAIAGKLLHLTEEEIIQAFGIAGSHASGTMEYDQSGGEVKRLHTGIAVRGGLQSAILAKYGLTGPRPIFEGKRGVLPAFAGQCRVESLAELDKEWGILNHLGFKRYSCVGANHNPIDLLAQIVAENHIESQQIDKIEVYVFKQNLIHGGTIVEPNDVIGAQFSLAYCLAIRLLKGSNDLDLYLDSKLWRDPQVLEIAHKVEVKADPEMTQERKFAARLQVRLKNGKAFEAAAECAKGFAGRPLAKEELQAKFRRLAAWALPEPQIEEIIRTVDKLEQVRDMNQLVALMVRRY